MSAQPAWEEREPGSRRKKFAGYWKAANELRQTYQQGYKQTWNQRGLQSDGSEDVPGSYPGASLTRNGDEQLVLFPSYARYRDRTKPSINPSSINPSTLQQTSNFGQEGRDAHYSSSAEPWRREWENDENQKAVVDVDVRGWIYAPQRGPMSRKNKLMMGVARQLSGIPAPRHNPAGSTASSRPTSPFEFGDRVQSHASRQQDELALRKAESIVRRGEAEAEVADQGRYSEKPSKADSIAPTSRSSSREVSPERFRGEFARQRRNQIWSDEDDRKAQLGATPTRMSQSEISIANANLLERVAPFMSNPLPNLRISAFFYNNDSSRMSSTDTDASGHFTIRQPLDFTPTQVKILALDGLTRTQDIKITAQHGISVISDIDDTIKHSAITSGAKEIFRNVFVRDLGELSIEGVRGWYNEMAQLGCEFHYVSNSPWQMYPILSSFFRTAGLPPGSFHLKQYSGMLQGIFEPVAERKKAAIDRLMRDFPDRQFILIGDSGEADLEVYTDAVREYPGRVAGVFIRDVTTSKKKSFFEPARGENGSKDQYPPPKPKNKPSITRQEISNASSSAREDADLREAIARSLTDVGRPSDALERSLSRHQKSSSRSSPARPPLPPRTFTAPAAPEAEDLIDLDSDTEHHSKSSETDGDELPKNWLRPPPPPSKPRALSSNRIDRSPSRESTADSTSTTTSKPSAPPRPRKPSTSVHVHNSVPLVHTDPSRPPPVPVDSRPPNTTTAATHSSGLGIAPPPPLPPSRYTYRDAARQKLTDAYNKMPSPKDIVFGSRSGSPRQSPSHSRTSSIDQSQWQHTSREPSLADLMNEERGRPPPLPPRRATGMSTTFQQMGINDDDDYLAYDNNDTRRHSSTGNTYGGYYSQQNPMLSKKEQAWQFRWEKAQQIMRSKGIPLKSWRVGEEAWQDAIDIIKAHKGAERGRTRQ